MENPYKAMCEQIISQQVFFAAMTEEEKKDPDVAYAILRLYHTRTALEKLMVKHERQHPNQN